MFNNAIGSITFQANSIKWSAFKRGIVDFNHMYRKTTKQIFKENQTAPGIKLKNANGASQPPKNSTTIKADIANRYTYSASMKNAQRKPVYSMW